MTVPAITLAAVKNRGVKHTRASVIKRAEAEYAALDAIVRRLKPADFDRPAMREDAPLRFTVKDVLAHVTAWKWRDVRRLTRDPRPVQPHQAPHGKTTPQMNPPIYPRPHPT